MKHLLFCLLLLLAGPVRAQLTESFTDGDFTQNPTWTGDVSGFQVTAQQLQSNGPAVTGTTLELVTPVTASPGTTWEFWANLKLATSGGNYADVWLLADQPSLKAAGTKGYFVRIGGADDEVALYRKDTPATPVYVVNGTNGTIGTTDNRVRVRVTRSLQDVWTLERDLNGGTAFVSEGTGTDATYQRGGWCGVSLLYSSANNRSFYFDDFRITDATAPALVRASTVAARQVDVTFNEAVAAAQAVGSYQLNGGAPAVLSAVRDATDPALVHLTLAADLAAGSNTLTVRNVADVYGNVAAGPLTATLTFAPPATVPAFAQLLITEILADETPVVGLPAAEFLEIHNPSATLTLDLRGVRLLRPNSTSAAAVFPAGAVLLPGEYAVVCGTTQVSNFTRYGKVFGLTNFPSLNNAGDQLLLRGANGRTLFEVRYADAWYRDAAKKDGGWTLEMIDTANPCGGAANWLASTDASGGTPGRANSVRAANADRTPPALRRATIISPTLLRLEFDEKLDSVQISAPALYSIQPALAVQSVRAVPYDFRAVELTLAAAVPANQLFTVTVQRALDCVGNATGGAVSATFALPVAPKVGEVIITEIFPDETPVIGLPASEYIEIHNPSANILDLGGVQLFKPGSTTASAVFPDTTRLLPGQYAVVCGSTRGALFARYGTVYALSNFPSLSNEGDQLVLRSRTGRTLFEVTYSSTWYKDRTKAEGGWALEIVDTANPCGGIENWTASTDASGGTPGRANSVRAANADRNPPALLRALALNPTLVRVFFAEKLDSVQAANPALYSLNPANAIAQASPLGPDFRAVDLTLTMPLLPNQPRTLTVQRATDCVGNAAGPATSTTFALPSAVAANDVVINEILFNPRTGGVDFVELLNRSAKYLNVQNWQLASEKADGTQDANPVGTGPLVLAPGQLLVLTTRPDLVQSSYPTHDPSAFLAMPAFPTFPDDAGTVVLLDAMGRPLDRVTYSAGQHLALLRDVNGVSLERIRTDGPSMAANFHSAAGTVGYATPGRPNSQYQDDPGGDKMFRVEPEIFTPDEDGQQDFTTLNYTLDQPGYAASITVYDAQGRLTRQLVRNETMATSGFFQWDGLTDQGRKAPVGYYVLHIQLFQPNSGRKQEYKKTVVLGARF
ncbi:lamin tail domain-containing protein [Hymenobacter daecheongensis]|uniref:lamin tail domain-containing protein n=1 Tax=Hymenobacter daecheongensis TaxID=496053 RepID=UPI001160EAE4|nr:lamin tail domain-containing protein [Hymenobacter daecheongensis]